MNAVLPSSPVKRHSKAHFSKKKIIATLYSFIAVLGSQKS
jgi:hypothetical protein